MNNRLTDYYGLNSDIAAAMRQADTLVEYDKYASIAKEANRIEEMRKLTEVPEYIKSGMGPTSSLLEEQQWILGCDFFLFRRTKTNRRNAENCYCS